MVIRANTLGSILLALAIILASCGAPPGTTDWCYSYDLGYGPPDLYEMSTNGVWVENVGVYSLHELTPVDQHLLTLSLMHNVPVNATMVSFTAGRDDAASGMNIAGNLQVFNLLQENFEYYIYSGIGLGEIYMTPTGSTGAAWDLNVSIAGDDEFYIQAITLWGYGSNPFPENNCDPIIPLDTPVPPEPSQTATSSSGAEASSTPTFTPSLTPPPTWCRIFDFISSIGDFDSYYDPGWTNGSGTTYSSGVGWVDGLRNRGASNESTRWSFIGRLMPAMTVTSVEVFAEMTMGTNVPSFTNVWAIKSGSTTLNYTTSSVSGSLSWTGSQSFTSQNWSFGGSISYRNNSTTPNGSGIITRIEMQGTGSDPMLSNSVTCESLTPTPTPTNTNTPPPATNTPTLTNTPGTPTSTRNPTQTLTIIPSATRTASATRTHIFTTTPSRTPAPATATRTASSTPEPATASRTPLPSPTIYGGPSATFLPTQTPGGATATPTGTPDPGGGGSAPGPGEVDFATYVAGFLNWLFNTVSDFFDYLGSLANYGVGTVANIITTINNAIATVGELLNLVFAYITDILTILRMLIELIIALIELIAGWAAQMISTGEGIIVTWYVVPAEAIPGMPQCYSDPTASDICAVYYIMQYTLLDGLLGSLIIIVIRVLLALAMIIYFVKTVRNWILKLQEMQA